MGSNSLVVANIGLAFPFYLLFWILEIYSDDIYNHRVLNLSSIEEYSAALHHKDPDGEMVQTEEWETISMVALVEWIYLYSTVKENNLNGSNNLVHY